MFTERGGLMLLRLMHLMHLMSMDTNATMLMIGKVWKTLLHRMQISRADGTLQDLAPILLGKSFNIRPHCSIALARRLMGVAMYSSAPQCAPYVLRGAST